MIRGHKILLNTTPIHEHYFARAAGVARFSYNWALASWNDIYEIQLQDDSVQGTSEMELRRELNRIKKENFPWMLEVTKCAPQLAIKNLGKAFRNFFAGRARHPTFKVKGRDDRFSVSNDHVEIKGQNIRLPHIGWISMKEALRFDGKILSVTVSRTADKWYASIAVEVTSLNSKLAKNHGKVGVDLGVNTLVTLCKDNYTFEKIQGSRPLKRFFPKLRLLSQALSRKVKNSKSWNMARIKLAKLHARISNIRLDNTHKLTTMLSSNYSTIVIEDLDVRGMMQRSQRGLSRSIADMAFGEFRRQLAYKVEARGGELILANRYFPSSKRCSNCHFVFKALAQGQQKWTCVGCKKNHDRDENGSCNLRQVESNV